MRVKDELAGRKVRCPDCQSVLSIPSVTADDDVPMVHITAEPPKPRPIAPRAWDAPPVPKRKWNEDETEEVPRTPKKKRRRRDEESTSYRGISLSPSIIVGLLMMVGAAIWFFGALAAGIIFFYPPILFVLGLISVIKGLLGKGDD